MTLEEALEKVKQEYERAKGLDFVYNPLAWALYRVWKQADRENPKENKRKGG